MIFLIFWKQFFKYSTISLRNCSFKRFIATDKAGYIALQYGVGDSVQRYSDG
jgi:hypothetical protein